MIAYIFTNHPNTLPLPVDMPMNASRPKIAENATDTQGRPWDVVLRKMLGALLFRARPSGTIT